MSKKIRIGNKSEKQKNILANINRLFNERNDAIKFVDDYTFFLNNCQNKQLGRFSSKN